MAKFDIVVPCYNYGRFLEACVRSVLSQSVSDVRVLIIDDASSDDSLLLAEKLAREDSRVTVIAHKENRGHIETYNEGIAWACSDYFLLLSADDLLVPGALRRAADVMDSDRDVVFTFGDFVGWHETDPEPIVAPVEGCAWTRFDLLTETCAAGANLVPTPTAIVRTKAQKAAGGYRKSLPHAADMEMWLRLAAQGQVARIDAVQAIYRKHGSAMSNAYYESVVGDYRQIQLTFDIFFEEHWRRLRSPRELRRMARRALAERVFNHGVRLLRRARFKIGGQLVLYAINIDSRLSYRPPLQELLRLPGPGGRDWAKSSLRNACGWFGLRGRAT